MSWPLLAAMPIVFRAMRLDWMVPAKFTPVTFVSMRFALSRSLPPSTPDPVTPVVLAKTC